MPNAVPDTTSDTPPHLSPFLKNIDTSRLVSSRKAAAEKSWAFIILDRFGTPVEEYRFWSSLAPVIGIDEGGPCRNDFDFLIDLLPCPPDWSKPNILNPALLPLPKNRRLHPWAASPDSAAEDLSGQTVTESPRKVLISFGAEDPAGLGKRCQTLLSRRPGKRRRTLSLDITWLDSASGQGIPNLREHLVEYDLVITHFGLTAFEAVYAGTPALLVSPGAYHEKLARTAGFISAGIGEQGCRRVYRFLSDAAFPERNSSRSHRHQYPLRRLHSSCRRVAEKYGLLMPSGQSLAGFLEKAFPLTSRTCPVCGAQAAVCSDQATVCNAQTMIANSHRTLARFPDRTYRRCPRCGMIYMNRLNPPPIEYEKEYFFDFYKKQYGKTYIEDFPDLINMGKKRLVIIKSILACSKPICRIRQFTGSAQQVTGLVQEFAGTVQQVADSGQQVTGLAQELAGTVQQVTGSMLQLAGNAGPGRLLDIGCAYGPFLQAAREEGFDPTGIDPAEDAVSYVKKELGIPAFRGFFPETGLGGRPNDVLKDGVFSAVTLWYVIEHFRSPLSALEECRRILMCGGVLAFSTPSVQGVSGRKSLRNFLEQSPADHWTVWSPGRCRTFLKKAGFTLKKIIITGHHPERFPLIGRFTGQKRGPVYQCCLLLSRIFGLGDTFEVYAVKTITPPQSRSQNE
jgi:2-polyprenyl-3-methyl-5-hydroxy-6-metoxy-1,4-benzoquinol methylase